MRPDRLYLADMLDAAEGIGRFLEGVSREDFLADELRRQAVLMNFVVLGEGAARVSPTLKAAHPELAWGDIVAFRNFAVHVYFAVKWTIVWDTATFDVPALREQLRRVLADEGLDRGRLS